MKLYRILTENKNLSAVRAIVAAQFEGFTILHGTGYWRGAPEYSLVVEVMTARADAVLDVAEKIRARNNQECVCVQALDVTHFAVTAPVKV